MFSINVISCNSRFMHSHSPSKVIIAMQIPASTHHSMVDGNPRRHKQPRKCRTKQVIVKSRHFFDLSTCNQLILVKGTCDDGNPISFDAALELENASLSTIANFHP